MFLSSEVNAFFEKSGKNVVHRIDLNVAVRRSPAELFALAFRLLNTHDVVVDIVHETHQNTLEGLGVGVGRNLGTV